MNDLPIYKKGDIVEVENYLANPFHLRDINMSKFLVDTIEEVNGNSERTIFFDETDFRKELERTGKIKYIFDERYLSPTPPLKGNGFIGTCKKERIAAWNNFDVHGIYGSIEKEFTYFTTNPTIALSHTSLDPLSDVEMIEIDNSSLSGKRKIFFDLESFFFVSERGKTFIIMGGVPKESIKRIYYMKRIR